MGRGSPRERWSGWLGLAETSRGTWGLATNRHNQVEVLPTLQVPDHPEVYIVGDLAGIQQDGHPLPMVAQGGIQTGTTAGRNILRQLAGEPPIPFHYHDKGTLDVIGRNTAVAYIWGRAFQGFLAWLIWVGVHIFNLIGFRNRLLVLVDWAWAYFFSEHGVRLIFPSDGSFGKRPDERQLRDRVGVREPQPVVESSRKAQKETGGSVGDKDEDFDRNKDKASHR